MTDNNFLLLVAEVRRLQKKYKKSGNGLILRDLEKKEAILDHEVEQQLKPRNPQQQLFEAR